ncbi:PTR2 domain-containing protein [Trichoderma chlorosporum]
MGHPNFIREATSEDTENLPRVVASLPWRVWCVLAISMMERFTYYGVTSPFQNYVQIGLNDTVRHGALGLGQSRSTSINLAFLFLSYTSPLLGAILADNWLGQYRVILLSSMLYALGIAILFATSFPVSLGAGAGLPGFIVSFIMIGLGSGGMKSNMPSFVIDQYPDTPEIVVRRDGNTEAIPDRKLTIQYIYNISYWLTNIGTLSGLATTSLENRIGFWAAYLLPLCSFTLVVAGLLVGRTHFVRRQEKRHTLAAAYHALWCALLAGFSLESLKKKGKWTPEFIDELKRVLIACRMFLFFIVGSLVFNQMDNNLVSQAGQMQSHGFPNDAFININPLAVIVLLPVVQKFWYPFCEKNHIAFNAVARIAVGFLFAAASMLYVTGVQILIYRSGPCYNWPLQCVPEVGPNTVNAWVQSPVYVLLAVAEIFATVSGTQIAYTEAPSSMKSVVQAMFILTGSAGAIVGIIISPAAKNPHLVIMFAALTVAMSAATAIFWILFRKYNKKI